MLSGSEIKVLKSDYGQAPFSLLISLNTRTVNFVADFPCGQVVIFTPYVVQIFGLYDSPGVNQVTRYDIRTNQNTVRVMPPRLFYSLSMYSGTPVPNPIPNQLFMIIYPYWEGRKFLTPVEHQLP